MKNLKLTPITFDISKLKPVTNEVGFDLNYNHVYKGYVDEFNEGIGDHAFNKAGAHLHELYFENVREFRPSNRPVAKAEAIIDMRYGGWENFVDTLMEQVGRLQGNGWVFMNTSGYVNIIPNNRIVDNVAMIIDLWEHAFLPSQGIDRNKYVRNHLNIINWDVVNQRIVTPKKENQ